MGILSETLDARNEVPLLDDFEMAELEAGLEELRNDIEQSESAIDETYRLIAGLESIDHTDVEMAKVRLESMFLYSDQASRFKDFEIGKDSLDGLINGLIAGCEAEKEGLFAKLKKLKRDYLSAYGSRNRKLKEVIGKLKSGASLNDSVDMGSSIIGIATADYPAKTDKDILKNINTYSNELKGVYDKWLPELESNVNKLADDMSSFTGPASVPRFAEYTFKVLTAFTDTTDIDKHIKLKKGLYSESKEDSASNVLLGGVRVTLSGHKIRLARGYDIDWMDVLRFSMDVKDLSYDVVKDVKNPSTSKIAIGSTKTLLDIADSALKVLESSEAALNREGTYPFFTMAKKTGSLASDIRQPNSGGRPAPEMNVAHNLQDAVFKWSRRPKNDLLKNTLKVTGAVITFLNKAVK